MADKTKGVDKSKIQGLTRIQFLTQVTETVNREAISQPAAYEIVEAAYIKRFGMRKYVNYDSFRYVNYRPLALEAKAKVANEKTLNEIYDLANKHKDGDLSTPDFVNELKPYIRKST